MDLTVVIPARNAASTIGEQLGALASQQWSGDWEIVVVDDASEDATMAVVEGVAENVERLRVITAGSRAGPAASRNLGVARSAGRSVAFCDADDVVGEGWVASMGEALERHELVTGPLELDRLNPPWLAGHRGRAHVVSLQRVAGVVPYGSSCNLGIRRSTLDELGGFDPDWAVGEDAELCIRAWRAGHDLAFEPLAVVHYRYRPAARERWRQAIRYGASEVRVVASLDDLVEPRGSTSAGRRRWAWLVKHAPLLLRRDGRARWSWVAGNRVGHLGASLRVRARAARARAVGP